MLLKFKEIFDKLKEKTNMEKHIEIINSLKNLFKLHIFCMLKYQ